MKKISYLLFLFVLAISVIAGCSSNDENEVTDPDAETKETSEENSEGEFPLTVTDATGDEITFDDKAERVVSVLPSNTEIAFALGLDEEIVGVTELDNYPEEASEKETVGDFQINVEKVIYLEHDVVLIDESVEENAVSGGLEEENDGVTELDKYPEEASEKETVGDFQINVEKVISLEPDVVLADESVDENALEQLRDSDINVLVVKTATDFDEVYDAIHLIAEVTDTTEEADKIETDMEEKLASIEEKVADIEEPKSVYVEISPSPETFTAGKNTFINTILEKINAENSAGDLEGWPEVNEEAVIKMNPDVILTTY